MKHKKVAKKQRREESFPLSTETKIRQDKKNIKIFKNTVEMIRILEPLETRSHHELRSSPVMNHGDEYAWHEWKGERRVGRRGQPSSPGARKGHRASQDRGRATMTG